jgi:UrcA family protein
MFQSIRITMLAGVVATAATGLAVSAVHAEPVARVRYSDLDLRSPAGQKMLTRRIAIAADRICDNGADPLTVANCRSTMIAQARSQIRTATGQGL